VVYRLVNALLMQRCGTPTEPCAANDQCCDQEQQPRWRLLAATFTTPLDATISSAACCPRCPRFLGFRGAVSDAAHR
jgi:hypothetical protein